MNQVIIYKQDNGTVAIITPTGELSIEEVAKKDVPPIVRYEGTGEFKTDEQTGETYEIQRKITEPRPYRIVNDDEVPSDRSFRNAWEYTE